jgi:outer membrane protein, multidrug efflux system
LKENLMRFQRSLPRWTALAVAALLAACGSLPPDGPLKPELPSTFAAAQGLERAGPPQSDWWAVMGDPVLASLVTRGLAANLDLQQAAERVQRSRALASGRRAELGPVVEASAGARAQQLGAIEAPGRDRAARRSDTVSAAVDLRWEIDLFGRVRQQALAASARNDAVAADAEALQLAVGAEIAQVWFAINGARAQLSLERGVIANRQAMLDLVMRRVAVGAGTPLDEARARAELSAAEADLPAGEAALGMATHRLAVLLGTSPAGYAAPEPASAPLRSVELRIPDPSQWLPLRPDVRRAEAQLRAQSLDVASIRSEFLPSLSVAGVLGFVAGSASGLGAAGSASWFVAPSLSVPVFDRGRIDARLQAARAGEREALLAYRQQVLLATEDVESALVRVRQGQLQLAALQQRARHAVTAAELAGKRFQAGASDMLEWLDAQRSAQQAERGLAAALTDQQQQVVVLHRSLGARFLPATGAVVPQPSIVAGDFRRE